MNKEHNNTNPEINELKDKIAHLEERIDVLEKLNEDLVYQNKELIEDNKRKEEILSFLPTQSIEDIKVKGDIKSVKYKMVTVLFSDIKGLTRLAERQEAETLIDELDRFFFNFDNVINKYNIQKVKSIGDTYMCAGGIPRKNRTNPIEVIMASLEMQNYLNELKEQSEKKKVDIWDVTIGIHTGPVVSYINGKRKINYEITGDTVNITSRIESSSDPGKITISAITYEAVKEFFVCDYKGKLPVKYKGDIALYNVKGYRPELSVDGKGKMPNKSFWTRLQIIRYEDLNEYILDLLERELPKHLYYHDLKHTIDVTIGVEVIASGEGISEEDILLLKTAALFHDTGQIYGSIRHEEKSCEIARNILQEFGYSTRQISIIEDLIMVTKLPPKPKTILQQIICDADLDYLGRSDFIPVSDTLYRELKVQDLIGSFKEWNQKQLDFLAKHQFFTATALSMRQVHKEKQIERLTKLIEENS